jgi:hypothetical protein
MSDDILDNPVPDVFCETLVRIETLGPCKRLVFAVRDESGGVKVRSITAKLIVSADAMVEIGRAMQTCEISQNGSMATFEMGGRARAN